MREKKLFRGLLYFSLSAIICVFAIGTAFAQTGPRIITDDINSTQIIINTLGWALSFIVSILSASFVYYIKTSITLTVNNAVANIDKRLGERSLEASGKWNDLYSKIAELRLECRKEYLPKEDMKEELHKLREEFKELREDFDKQLENLRAMIDRRKEDHYPPDSTYKRQGD